MSDECQHDCTGVELGNGGWNVVCGCCGKVLIKTHCNKRVIAEQLEQAYHKGLDQGRANKQSSRSVSRFKVDLGSGTDPIIVPLRELAAAVNGGLSCSMYVQMAKVTKVKCCPTCSQEM